MPELRDLISRLDDTTLESAEHAERQTMNFSEAVRYIRVVRRLAEAFTLEADDELPDSVGGQARSSLEELVRQVDLMVTFDTDRQQAYSDWQQIEAQVHGIYNSWRNQLRQHIRGSVPVSEAIAEVDRRRSEIDSATVRAQSMITSAEAAAEEADLVLSRVQRLSGEVGAGTLSKYYKEAAKRHADSSRWFLVGSAVTATGLAIAGWLLFGQVQDSGSSHWPAYVRELTERVFVLGVVLYALAFLVKGYRTNQHLKVVNEHKRNALDTFILFQESATSDATRDMITAELVRAVFASDQTGFLDTAPDKTIVEQTSGLMGMLAARRG